MTRALPKWSSSIRVRLTVLYTGTFFLAGLMLITVVYLGLAQVVGQQLVVRAGLVDPPPGTVTVTPAPPPGVETEPPRDTVTTEHLRGANTPEVLDRMAESVSRLEVQYRRARRATLNRMLFSSLALLGVMTAVAGVLGWGLAGQALYPLRQITATARRVADRNLHERIALAGRSDEIKDLADTLDTMFERIDQAFDSQQRFIANASHELRTPLAINRTLIEVALMDAPESNERLRQLGSTLLAVNQRHERLIDGLLTLTGSEQRIVDPAPVDLAEIAAHALSEAGKRVQDANLDVQTALEPAPASGEPVLLERLAENLIENAIRYNLAEGGWVRVATGTVGGRVELVVENPGPLIPHYDAPRLFEPFQRLSRDERRADPTGGSTTRGAGLGLSIVRAVAHAHGGEAAATPREGGGLIVRVSMPAIALSEEDKPPVGAD